MIERTVGGLSQVCDAGLRQTIPGTLSEVTGRVPRSRQCCKNKVTKLEKSQKMVDCGVLYIAFGEQYRHEALTSIASLRRFHPHLPCCIITDSEFGERPTDVEVILREPEIEQPFRAKPRYLRESPFDRTLFLDTDTTVVGAVEPLFYLLDRFDIGLHMHPHYRTYGTYERGGYLSTANTGVVLFRRCAAVTEMFDRWLEAFDREASAVQSRITDDPTLMYAVYDTRVRLVPLPSAMNFLLQIPTVTASPIHIIHGRYPDPEGLARRIDQGRPSGLQHWNPRVWVPQLQSPLPDGSLRSASIWTSAPLYALHIVASRFWTLLVRRKRQPSFPFSFRRRD